MTSRWPGAVLAAAVIAVALLAPLVPDEPFHLSGVMLVAGIGMAVIAALGGVVQAARSEDEEARSEGRWIAGLAALVIAGVVVALVMRSMSQLS